MLRAPFGVCVLSHRTCRFLYFLCDGLVRLPDAWSGSPVSRKGLPIRAHKVAKRLDRAFSTTAGDFHSIAMEPGFALLDVPRSRTHDRLNFSIVCVVLAGNRALARPALRNDGCLCFIATDLCVFSIGEKVCVFAEWRAS